MRKQNAVYWPPGTKDDFGKQSHGDLVELVRYNGVGNFRVRWEDNIEVFIDASGSTQRSNALVYVPILCNGDELQVGGFLWLGDKVDLTDEVDPRNNVDAYELRRLDKLPNFKSTAFLRTAYL